MGIKRGKNNSKGIKRARIATDFSNSNLHEVPCQKWLNRGSGSGLWLYKCQSNGGDSFDISNPLNLLSDDVVITILSKVSAAASSPADLINVLLVNKRFGGLVLDREVLKNAAGKCFSVRAKNWSECAHQFLARCANAGNLEACHFLGMIKFYCLENHATGIELLKKAAQGSHAGALYSLAIIYFNGSGSLEGGLRRECDPDSAAHLCIKSANLGNLDALREAAYCFQYGLGLPCSPSVARNLHCRANTLQLIKTKNTSNPRHGPNHQRLHKSGSLLTNYGFYEQIGREVHAANKFMVEWWWLACRGDERKDGLNMCSNVLCGRRETRSGGFRKCSRCRIMTYCSHACQEIHWKMEHGSSCIGHNVPGELV